ncbi:hypothetical protein Bpfe_026221 [Biomphalaria pfeifferi]|uniref:Uncharacterized protein n=1 Tax=Biomphalaria pfeifferi TaxID=112525 RepID=A0AAD8B0C9_BIOPF|nr:hypothetical protein Bpfe_026221 [Biomphalaria pfeifferi]
MVLSVKSNQGQGFKQRGRVRNLSVFYIRTRNNERRDKNGAADMANVLDVLLADDKMAPRWVPCETAARQVLESSDGLVTLVWQR